MTRSGSGMPKPCTVIAIYLVSPIEYKTIHVVQIFSRGDMVV